ncbi:MAG TPA: hypothetical protein DDW76_12805 [Cyanobacteria bacterium UBA11369]|nr:hypothetical protein [Cyanobacteria bacterium UBA11371]HBE49645.1 hypothetical protein [Cyanobacteria bacterium UBA11369]
MSALANQTIWHTTSVVGKKVKAYKSVSPEINKQNWSIHGGAKHLRLKIMQITEKLSTQMLRPYKLIV